MERTRVGARVFAGWVCGIVVLLVCLSPQSPVTAQAACYIDSPDCVGCFDDNGAWDPYGTLLEVAEQTLGTRESCVANGGQPFYQMQRGINSAARAQAMASCFWTKWIDRSAWCSETIAYWHREANVPYPGGYVTLWHPSWQTYNVDQLRTWYMTAEVLGGRGRWIESTELDLDNFIPGVNAPCPGAYQQLMGYSLELSQWSGPANAHSQVVDSMTVYRYPDGKVIDFDLQMIEGNSSPDGVPVDMVHNTNVYDSAPRFMPDGGIEPNDFLGKNRDRKIRGWGIDRYPGGAPICRMDKITYVYVPEYIPFLYGHLYPYLIVDQADEAQVEEIHKFAAEMERWGGVRRTLNDEAPSYAPLPSPRQPWPIDVPKKQAVVEVEFPLPPPYPVGSVELQFVGEDLPGIVTVHVRGADASVNLRKGNLRESGATAILTLPKPTSTTKYRFWIAAPGGKTLSDTAISGIDFHPYADPAQEDSDENR